jgi:hypothetical protein
VPLVVERLLSAARCFVVYAGVQSSALLGLPSRLLFPAASLVIQLCGSSLCVSFYSYTPDWVRFTSIAFVRSTGARNEGSRFARD